MNDAANAYVDWKNWDGNDFARFTGDEATYFAAETALRTASRGRVLEIGFGNGHFLGWAKSIGSEVFGIETNPMLVTRARRFLGEDQIFNNLEDPRISSLRGSFTHVVAFDVIEHMSPDSVVAVLRQLCDLLASGGRVIVRFPNGDSPFGRVTQHGDPTHVNTIGYQKLAYLANQAGLTVEELRAPALPVFGTATTTAVKRLLLKAGRWPIERLVSILYYGGRRIPLDPNYVAVLVRANTLPTP
jgi:SAM-dependent methyltransferase